MQDRESIVIKSDPQVLRWQLVLQHFNFTRVHMHNSGVGPVVCFLYLLLSLFGSFIGRLFFSPCVYVRSALAPVCVGLPLCVYVCALACPRPVCVCSLRSCPCVCVRLPL